MDLFESANDVFARPASALADFLWVDFGGAEGLIVACEMPDGRGVQAGILALDCPAVERLMIAMTLSQLKNNCVAGPFAIAVDLIGVEACREQGAVPTAEQPRMKRCALY
jgi:hypothetical protein